MSGRGTILAIVLAACSGQAGCRHPPAPTAELPEEKDAGAEPAAALTTEVEDMWEDERLEMVAEQIEARGISDARVLDAMRKVPRHSFVPEQWASQSYEDHPLPIGWGQTISQPYIVAVMSAALELEGDEKVLEVGTGSGYQAAILSVLAKEEKYHIGYLKS